MLESKILRLYSLGLALWALGSVCAAQGLPSEVQMALQKAKLPREAMVAVVQEVGSRTSVLQWQGDKSVNPASVMKLFTTYAALDLLGPAWSWTTPVWVQGTLDKGVLSGNLVIKGQGDPKLVMERLWLLLRRVQQWGVREIRGDIIIDRSAFRVPSTDPAEFDGEPHRPYNVSADALLLNYKSLVLTFTPDLARNVATVSVDPPLADLQHDVSVPLSNTACADWRAELKADFSLTQRLRWSGSYPVACGERTWPLALDPEGYNQRSLLGMWKNLGGQLSGQVREGAAPSTPPSFEMASESLAGVVRDINKFSNNVMAQQLFLTLGLTQRGLGTPDNARAVVYEWAAQRLGAQSQEWVLDNGSGLSRQTRVSADLLARLLQSAWASPVMPEFMASLPIGGVDGTLKRAQAHQGRTHLKTGSLRDTAAVAGYVLHPSGRRFVLVASINHPQAQAGRAALEALVQWASSPAAIAQGAP